MSHIEPREAARQLDAMDGSDPEAHHGYADELLLDQAPAEVRDAYERLVQRCGWWATA